METMMSAAAAQAATSQLPPGFRFHPTDEELILHYLRNRAASSPCPVPIIADVDIYKFDPWDLPAKALYGDGEYYFFSPRDRKYPNGIRPNRAAGSGYWKATGTDKPIHDSATGESVGVKKALVFYKGRPPRGTKTNWIMHEYCVSGPGLGEAGRYKYRLAAAANAQLAAAAYRPPSKFRNVSMRLDDWVLCRIYKKSGQASPMVPPLADYEHLDHDEPNYSSSGGGGGFDDICGFYAPTSSSATSGAFMQQQPPPLPRLPKIPSISDLLDEYALAQIFDTAVPADQDPLAVHPSLNQLLAVGGDGGAHSDLATIYSPSAAGGGGKRRAMMGPNDEHHQPPAKRHINGSCFDAPSQPASALPATTSSVLGSLGHHMLSQF